MKYFTASLIVVVAVAAITVYALDADTSSGVEKFIAECATEFGVSSDEVKSMMIGDFTKSSDKLQCFAKCLLERSGFMENGKLNEKLIVEIVQKKEPKEDVQKIVDVCKTLKGKNECEMAYNAVKCYHQHKASLA